MAECKAGGCAISTLARLIDAVTERFEDDDIKPGVKISQLGPHKNTKDSLGKIITSHTVYASITRYENSPEPKYGFVKKGPRKVVICSVIRKTADEAIEALAVAFDNTIMKQLIDASFGRSNR